MITCDECGATAEHSQSDTLPPPGWMRFVRGWICGVHDVPFTEIMSELSLVCEKLDRQDGLTLESAMELYFAGVTLQIKANSALDSAHRRLVEVVGQDGVMRSFEEHQSLRKKPQ